MGVWRAPGSTVGEHTGQVPWVNALRDSRTPGPGAGGEITCSVGRRRRFVPRGAAIIPQPTNEIKGGAQSGSLLEVPR